MMAHAPAASSRALLPPRLRAAHPIGRAARVALVAAAFAAAISFDVPLCPFAIVTRHPCPGCGLTRATLAILHGHLAESLHLHPLALVVSPLVAAMLAYNAYSYVKSGKHAAAEAISSRRATQLIGALGVVMIAVWIARFFGALGGPVPV
jgi:hypothetical protein